jgi:hypothetical protein
MKRKLTMVTMIAAMAALCGCQSPVVDVVAPPVVGAAACALVSKQPATAGYVKLVGTTFADLGRGVAPTPEALQSALADVPAQGLERAVAMAVWSGAVGAYAVLYNGSTNTVQKQRLCTVLTSLGTSLQSAAVNCVPATTNTAATSRSVAAPAPPLKAEDVTPLARAVELDFASGSRATARR